MDKRQLKAAIFDLDGVIVNTVPIHFKAWQRMFADYGVNFTFEDYKLKVDGIPRTDGAKAILLELSDEELEKAAEKKQNYFLESLEKISIPVFDSTILFIKELRENNIKTAIISASKNCHSILKRAKLLNLFDVEITGNDITKGKPDPQIFLMASQKLFIDTKDCVVFEDAVLGVKAAKRADMLCVGIDRHNDPNRLKEADVIISDLDDISYEKLVLLFRK